MLGDKQKKASSYEYGMEASFAYLERGSSSWFITDLKRESTGFKNKEEIVISIPSSIKEDFISYWLKKHSIEFEAEASLNS